VITRGQLANDTIDRLFLLIDNLLPDLDMALLYYIEKVTDLALAHNDFALVEPLSFEAIE